MAFVLSNKIIWRVHINREPVLQIGATTPLYSNKICSIKF